MNYCHFEFLQLRPGDTIYKAAVPLSLSNIPFKILKQNALTSEEQNFKNGICSKMGKIAHRLIMTLIKIMTICSERGIISIHNRFNF